MLITSFKSWQEEQIQLFYSNLNKKSKIEINCPDCDGSGEEECCECGHEIECGRCSGDGTIKIARSQASAGDLERLFSLSKYEKVVIEETTLLDQWTNRPAFSSLVSSGLMPYMNVHFFKDLKDGSYKARKASEEIRLNLSSPSDPTGVTL